MKGLYVHYKWRRHWASVEAVSDFALDGLMQTSPTGLEAKPHLLKFSA